jgi:hypothetical protein
MIKMAGKKFSQWSVKKENLFCVCRGERPFARTLFLLAQWSPPEVGNPALIFVLLCIPEKVSLRNFSGIFDKTE